MNSRQVVANMMVAILVIGTISAVGISFPAQQASAQSVTITTSADSHGKKFFGEGVLQVVINDPDADDDTAVEDKSVTIKATQREDGTSSSTGSFTVFETSKSSSKFEFYLAHEDSGIAAADLDPISSTDAVEYDTPPVDDTVNLIRWGPDDVGTNDNDLKLNSDLYEDVDFEITVGNTKYTVNYQDSQAQIELDRDVYGSTENIVHMFIIDQDANLDPTNADSFTLSEADLDDTVFDLSGAQFDDDVLFEEDGDNTARFEATLTLDDSDTAGQTLEYTEGGDGQSVSITLNDQAKYFDPIDDDGSTDTDDTDFRIDDVDGDVSDFGAITFGSELKFTVTDNDQNKDSDIEDTLSEAVDVCTEGSEPGDIAAGGDCVVVDLEETDENTGIFELKTTNQEIKVNFVSGPGAVNTGDSILQLHKATITDDITVTYHDPANDDGDEEPLSQEFSMTIARPSVQLPDTVGVNDDFTLQVTDANLNDNPRTRDSYTIKLHLDGTGTNHEHGLLQGASDLSSLATIQVKVESKDVTFATDITETLVETGINTGIFTSTFDMQELLSKTGATNIDDGDSVQFKLRDKFDDQSHEASDQISIGKANTGVDFSRNVLPIPPEDGSATAEGIGSTVSVVTFIVTDPDQNLNSNTEDAIEWCWVDDDCHQDDGDPAFSVEIDGDGSSNDEEITTQAEFDASDVLQTILPGLDSITLTETGRATGVFEEELEFELGDLDTDEWQDLEVTITYTDSDDDEEEAGVTFRGNDGVVDIDADSVKNGDTITVTIQDEDLNLDDDTAEEFEASIDASGNDYLLAVETDDDDVCDETDGSQCPTTETFRETGTDTGIFTATYRIGEDIPVTEQDSNGEDIVQASVIVITYNDEIDSSGGSGDEIEIDIPVVTATGAITVQPELVGPGTEITVIITDSDLNKNPTGSDDYDPEDSSSDDFFVNFRSDRREVGEASPEIEETGANTGVFQFTIELVTDENACEDDDLGASKFDARGGSEPKIGACPGDLISIRYTDEQGADGRTQTVSKVVEVKSFDPEFATDKESYNVGDKVVVSISDPDANRDPDIADSLTDLRVFSTTDLVGAEISALETGKNTGVFKVTIQTTASSSQGNQVTVKTGDDLTVEYEDQYPADFEDQEDDKTFDFTVPIEGNVGTKATTPSAPVAKDVQGKTLSSVSAGQQVILSTTVVNNNDQSQPFAAIVEVRDSSGITVYLAWQTGTLNPNGRAEVGLSWTPGEAGNYTVRTFVISDLSNPRILSEVKTSTISVS